MQNRGDFKKLTHLEPEKDQEIHDLTVEHERCEQGVLSDLNVDT